MCVSTEAVRSISYQQKSNEILNASISTTGNETNSHKEKADNSSTGSKANPIEERA